MEKGGMKGGREWCSLTWACRRPYPIMCASRHSQAVVSGAAIVISVHGCLCPFVGMHVRSWALMSCSCLFVGVRVHLWALVSRSCLFVGPRVTFVGVHVTFVSIGGRSYLLVGIPLGVGWCDVGPVSHVKEEEGGGRGVVRLTCMHNARRGTSSSPCTGLVTWRCGVVLVCSGVAMCCGLCEVDGGR